MTTQEALREQLHKAIQNADRLFGQFIQMLGNSSLTDVDRRIALSLYRDANERVCELRALLGGLLEAEWIASQSESIDPANPPTPL